MTALTLDLPNQLYDRLRQVADQQGLSLDAWVLDTLQVQADSPLPVHKLSDEALLNALDAQLEARDDARLSQLLYLKQAGQLGNAEQTELDRRMVDYQNALLRKAQAMNEAAQRHLRSLPEP